MWSLLSIIPASIIFYQDLKHRAISWWTLPLLAITLGLESYSKNDLSVLYTNIGINLCVLVIQFLVVWIYFSFKNKKITNIFHAYIGIGDVLFLVAITPFFNPIHFLAFEIIGLIFVLLGSLFYGLRKENWEFKIPLAGIFALLLIITVIYIHLLK